MKAGKIILKNLRLLLRSRISTLVIILGPLLVIVLVGIAFSTSTFNLNIGVYSEKYSDLSNSLVDNLREDNFAVSKYETEQLCNVSVQEGQSHACVVFPPNMAIENEAANKIKFYVDQSKVNLVYLVMSTLRETVGERSVEISRDLTDIIVTTLFNTKNDLQDSQEDLSEILNDNSEVYTKSESSIDSLEGLDLTLDSSVDVSTVIASIQSDLDDLYEDSIVIVDESLELAEDDLMDYVDDVGNNKSNVYENDIEDLIEQLEELNSTLKESQNSTAEDLNEFANEINELVDDMSEKLENVDNVNTDVLTKLNNIKDRSDNLREKSENLDSRINRLISDINAIQITNIENIVSPISTEIHPIVQSQTNLGFLFPSLIVMLIMFIGLLLPSTLIIMEKKSKAYFRVFTTPTRSWWFVLSTYLTSLLLILFQLIIIIAVSQYYFSINFMNTLFILILSLFVIMSFFILVGMLIGYIFNTEELAMLASVSLGSLFLLTSGIIFPLESMPTYVSDIAKFNPVVLGSDMFKKSILFGTDFISVRTPLSYMILFSVAVLVIIFAVQKLQKLHYRLKKPSRKKIRKEQLIELFDFGERKAKTLPEFLVAVQNINEEKFHALLNENAYVEWLMLVYRNKYLAKLIANVKTKDELITTLTDELKKISKK